VSLKEMTDLNALGDGEPVSGVAAVHALYGLGLGHDAVQTN